LEKLGIKLNNDGKIKAKVGEKAIIIPFKIPTNKELEPIVAEEYMEDRLEQLFNLVHTDPYFKNLVAHQRAKLKDEQFVKEKITKPLIKVLVQYGKDKDFKEIDAKYLDKLNKRSIMVEIYETLLKEEIPQSLGVINVQAEKPYFAYEHEIDGKNYCDGELKLDGPIKIHNRSTNELKYKGTKLVIWAGAQGFDTVFYIRIYKDDSDYDVINAGTTMGSYPTFKDLIMAFNEDYIVYQKIGKEWIDVDLLEKISNKADSRGGYAIHQRPDIIKEVKAMKIGDTVYIRADRSIDRVEENLYTYNDQGLYYRDFDLENMIKFLNGESYVAIREYEQKFDVKGNAIYDEKSDGKKSADKPFFECVNAIIDDEDGELVFNPTTKRSINKYRSKMTMHKTEHLDLAQGDEKLAFDDFVFKYVYVCMSGTVDKKGQFDEDNREYICRICDNPIEPSHIIEKHKIKPLKKSDGKKVKDNPKDSRMKTMHYVWELYTEDYPTFNEDEEKEDREKTENALNEVNNLFGNISSYPLLLASIRDSKELPGEVLEWLQYTLRYAKEKIEDNEDRAKFTRIKEDIEQITKDITQK
jgi:hypothetical protein